MNSKLLHVKCARVEYQGCRCGGFFYSSELALKKLNVQPDWIWGYTLVFANISRVIEDLAELSTLL